MRLFATLLALAFGTLPAAGHPGHVAEAAGHGHWIALGALVLAGALAAWAKKKKPDDDVAEDDAPEDAEGERA